jgi:hypothetical protein
MSHISGSDLAKESLSITTMALSLARQLGGAPIILCGVDLAYVSNERYATGVVSAGSHHSADHAGQTKSALSAVCPCPMRKELWSTPRSTGR